MNDTILRKKVKLLKANNSIQNYYELAELLELNIKSFYNWLNGYYNFSYDRKKKLENIIELLFTPE